MLPILFQPKKNGRNQTTYNDDDSKKIPNILILFVEDESCPEDERHSKSFKGFHERSSTAQSSVCGYLKKLTVLVRPFTNTLSYSLNHQALSSDKMSHLSYRHYRSEEHLPSLPLSNLPQPDLPH